MFRTPETHNVGTTHRTSRSSRCSATSRSATTSSGRRRVGLDALHRGLGIDPDKIWITASRGTRSWPRARTGGDRRLARDRHPARAESSCATARRTSGRRDRRALRDLLGAVRRPWPGLGSRTTSGGETSASSSSDLVFMEFDQDPVGTLTPLPAKNIDTGLGLQPPRRLLQGTPRCSRPTSSAVIERGAELSGKRYGETFATDRARAHPGRHTRGRVPDRRRRLPSNEDRGYVLRRVMRRAIVQGRGSASSPGSCRASRPSCAS